MEEQFELERFEWRAPDRLEIAGKFHGLQATPAEEPVLVVNGGEHSLRSDPETAPGPPEDGESWCAQFVWDETPIAVEAAALALGPDVVVDLPAPGSKRTLLRPRFLEIRPGRKPAADIGLQAALVAAE